MWSSHATDDQPVYCLPAGDYWIQVMKAEQKISPKGYDMLALELRADGCNGKLWENLFDPEQVPTTKWRSDAFALATGLAANKGAAYTIDPDRLVGLRFKATLSVADKPGKDKNGNPAMFRNNAITRYIPRSSAGPDSSGARQQTAPQAAPAYEQPTPPPPDDCPPIDESAMPTGDKIPF